MSVITYAAIRSSLIVAKHKIEQVDQNDSDHHRERRKFPAGSDERDRKTHASAHHKGWFGQIMQSPELPTCASFRHSSRHLIIDAGIDPVIQTCQERVHEMILHVRT